MRMSRWGLLIWQVGLNANFNFVLTRIVLLIVCWTFTVSLQKYQGKLSGSKKYFFAKLMGEILTFMKKVLNECFGDNITNFKKF